VIYTIALAILVAGGTVYWAVNSLGQSAADLKKLSLHKEMVGDLQLSISQVVMPGNDYLLSGNPEEKQTHMEFDNKVNESILKVTPVLTSDNAKALMGQIEKNMMK